MEYVQILIQKLNDLLAIGAEPKNFTFFQTSVRAVVVFLAALIMVRLSSRRFLSNKTAFDAILVFILASMLARAVNGSVAFWQSLGGGFVLVALHRLLAALSCTSHRFGELVKGRPALVIEDGEIKRQTMRANQISEHDLLEDLRLNGNVDDPKKVKKAFLERDGQITVVK